MIARLKNMALVAAAMLLGIASPSPSQAGDFFSALFGGLNGGRQHTPYVSMPFADETRPLPPGEARPRVEGEPRPRMTGQAYCVRTCDGRYFPLPAADRQSRAATCSSFCPASETKVVYGSDIDNAATDSGKSYSELPNAFRYRNEIVAGCTCNGKDQLGLAQIKIENDPTLRKGDIVAGDNGLQVAGRSAEKRGAALNFSPAPEHIRARYARVPVVAAED
jgi:hypothetical protein